MKKKDLNNTYSSKPVTFSQNVNEATGAYTKTSTENEIETKNKDFVQINIKYQIELSELAITNPVANAILMLFITRMENNNTYIISAAQLAKAVHKNKRTIERAIATLREKNFIATYLKIRENMGAVYFINPAVACKCSANRKQYLINKYLEITENKEYKASKDIIDIEALVSKDRLVLKSDERAQLDKLNRIDNVKISGMMEITNLIDSMSQGEILALLQTLKREIPATEEELEKTKEEIEQREKALELMQRKQEIIEKESKAVVCLQAAENEQESIKQNKLSAYNQFVRLASGKIFEVEADGKLKQIMGYIPQSIRILAKDINVDEYNIEYNKNEYALGTDYIQRNDDDDDDPFGLFKEKDTCEKADYVSSMNLI